MSSQSISYRPELDGMRCVAVVAVLLCHHHVSGFAGGFVGVDVFFVLSGFLITSTILKTIDEGQFSLSGFWQRRIKRIMPASCATIIGTLVACYFVFSPADLTQTAVSALYQTFFMENMHQAYSETGYFALSSESQPLLHMWSLAVEEQFYIIYPIILVFVVRKRRSLVFQVILVLAAGSFAYSSYLSVHSSTAAYYVLASRAWEMLCGCLIVFARIPRSGRVTRELSSIVGLIMIIVAIVSYDESTIFPGVGALLPVIGTVIFIISNGDQQTWIGKIFSTVPMVFVGKISYSLYLWHWPALVLVKYWSIGDLTRLATLGTVALSFALAVGCYYLLESPIRKWRLNSKAAYRLGGGLVFSSLAMALLVIGFDGWPSRFKNYVMTDALLVKSNDDFINLNSDQVRKRFDHDDLFPFGFIDQDGPAFLVWGDSHSVPIRLVIDRFARQYGIGGYAVTRSGTLPVPGLWLPRDDTCPDDYLFHNQETLDYVISRRIPHVILIARWMYVVNSDETESVEDQDNPEKGERGSLVSLNYRLHSLVETLNDHGVQVWVMLQVPQHAFHVPNMLVARRGRVQGMTLSKYQEKQGRVNAALRASGANILDPVPYLFGEDGRVMLVTPDQFPLWSDSNHLNKLGAEKLAPLFEGVMKEIARDRRSR